MLKQGQHFTQFLGVHQNKLLAKYLVLEIKHLKQLNSNKLIKHLYGTVNGKGWILTTASKPSNPTKPSTNNQLTVTNNSGVAQINAKIVAYILQFMTLKERQQIKSNVHCQ